MIDDRGVGDGVVVVVVDGVVVVVVVDDGVVVEINGETVAAVDVDERASVGLGGGPLKGNQRRTLLTENT
jgi:hypothetical protein